jgi:hypothetical protein
MTPQRSRPQQFPEGRERSLGGLLDPVSGWLGWDGRRVGAPSHQLALLGGPYLVSLLNQT